MTTSTTSVRSRRTSLPRRGSTKARRSAAVYNLADDVTLRMVEEADVVEGCRAIGFTLGAPSVSMLGVVEDVLVDRAFVEDRAAFARTPGPARRRPSRWRRTTSPTHSRLPPSRAPSASPPSAVRDGLRSFVPAAHRIALVGTVHRGHLRRRLEGHERARGADVARSVRVDRVDRRRHGQGPGVRRPRGAGARPAAWSRAPRRGPRVIAASAGPTRSGCARDRRREPRDWCHGGCRAGGLRRWRRRGDTVLLAPGAHRGTCSATTPIVVVSSRRRGGARRLRARRELAGPLHDADGRSTSRRRRPRGPSTGLPAPRSPAEHLLPVARNHVAAADPRSHHGALGLEHRELQVFGSVVHVGATTGDSSLSSESWPCSSPRAPPSSSGAEVRGCCSHSPSACWWRSCCVGVEVAGQRNWIEIFGPFRLQPSEFAKLALVVWGASLLTRKDQPIDTWKGLLLPLLPVVGVMMLLVLMEGDFGNTLMLAAITMGMLFAAGAPLRLFAWSGRGHRTRRAAADTCGPLSNAALHVVAAPRRRPARLRMAGAAGSVRPRHWWLLGGWPRGQP